MPRIDLDNLDLRMSKKAAQALTRTVLTPYLVAQYSQDDVNGHNFPKWAKIGGICLGLSLYWIRLHQSNRNTPRLGEQGLLHSNQVVVEARRIQLVYQDSLKVAGATDRPAQQAAIGAACASVKATAVGALTRYGLGDAGLMTALRQVHRYHVLSLTGFGDGHAIAAYMSSGKIFGLARHVYLFDPNIGEFKIPEGDLDYALEALAARYKSINLPYNACYLSEVKP
jgi:hypothetical protein